MKIAIDARSLTKNLTGIANFLINALNELISQRPDWDFYLLVHKPLNDDIEKKLVKSDNVKIIIDSQRFLKVGTLWYLVRLNKLLKKIEPDYFWSPATLIPFGFDYKIKTLVTVHDVVFKEYKNTMNKFNLFIHTLLFDKSIKKADIIWTVSDYTKNKVIEYYPKISKDVFVGSSVDKSIYQRILISDQEKKLIFAKYGISNKFLLFIGTLEPRKNISYLLSLMPDLFKDDYSLLIVGAKGWGNTEIKAIIEANSFPKDKVIFADFTPPQELIKLYNLAHIYISTSLNEGFGLPQLEAMSCACPVITSHNSAMIEVVENAGITVKGFEKNDWLKAIKEVSDNREYYAERCYEKSKNYNWKNIIFELIKVIENRI